MAKKPTASSPRALFDACDIFARVTEVLDALPDTHRIGDSEPLRDVLPSYWPTVGDARKLHATMVAMGWNKNYTVKKRSA